MLNESRTEPLIDPVYTEVQIAERVKELAVDIAAAWPGELTIVGLLRGSFVFAADLVRQLHAHGTKVQMDFLTLSSYGNATQSSGQVELRKDISDSVQGKDVLIVDDILETGQTLHAAIELLQSRGARHVDAAVLLEKPGKLIKPVQARWVGFAVEDKFVVGYGLDYQNYYRELPYIGAICEK